MKVVYDGRVVVCCDVCGNNADCGRIVFVSVHALVDGVAADETHVSLGDFQNAVVEVVYGVVGLVDEAAEVFNPCNSFATSFEFKHVTTHSDAEGLLINLYLDYVLKAEETDGT